MGMHGHYHEARPCEEIATQSQMDSDCCADLTLDPVPFIICWHTYSMYFICSFLILFVCSNNQKDRNNRAGCCRRRHPKKFQVSNLCMSIHLLSISSGVAIKVLYTYQPLPPEAASAFGLHNIRAHGNTEGNGSCLREPRMGPFEWCLSHWIITWVILESNIHCDLRG